MNTSYLWNKVAGKDIASEPIPLYIRSQEQQICEFEVKRKNENKTFHDLTRPQNK